MGNDEEELARLGYVQQLRRTMGAFGSFALSFSVISILTGGVSLYGFGLNHGGPIEMTIGWPVVTIMIGAKLPGTSNGSGLPVAARIVIALLVSSSV